MTRKGEINAANPYAGSSEIAYGKKIGFIIGAEWADAHPKNPWISVKDRLPKERSHVFTAGGTRTYNILLYHAGKFYQSLSQGLYDGGVTHWMPIPELNVEPKE